MKPVPSAQRAATSTPPKRPIRRSGEFHRDGKYYLFSQHAVLVIRGWPTLKAWRRTNSGTHWKHVRPTLDLQHPGPIVSPSTPRLLDDDFSGVPPDRAHPLVALLADVVGMFRFLRIPNHTRFRNLAEVQQAHDRLVQQLVEIGINPPNTPIPGRITDLTESLALPFPSPPVPGSSYILPLTRPIELLQEGREMHHCVGSYIPQVQEGSTYIYRVLAPERATLALHRYGNSWSLGQIYGPFNEPVQPSTREAIRSWLEQARPIPEPSEGSPDWLQFQLDF